MKAITEEEVYESLYETLMLARYSIDTFKSVLILESSAKYNFEELSEVEQRSYRGLRSMAQSQIYVALAKLGDKASSASFTRLGKQPNGQKAKEWLDENELLLSRVKNIRDKLAAHSEAKPKVRHVPAENTFEWEDFEHLISGATQVVWKMAYEGGFSEIAGRIISEIGNNSILRILERSLPTTN